MIRSFRVFAFLFVLGAIPSFVLALEEELKTIPTRPKVTQSFVLIRPTGSPVGSVILFTGGNGVLNLSAERMAEWQPTNFLVRNRMRLAEHGFLVAVVDAPSDRLEQGLAGFRTTPDHAEDIRQVIAVLCQIRDVPVWLAGTSMGTVSAANVA